MAQLTTRSHVPQAFVSSYAPRIRAFTNSLLTPVQPATVIPPLRTTKRGTTAINYSEDFEDDGIDDSDGLRRTGRGRRLDDLQLDKSGLVKEQGRELSAPVDVQAIWREWMGKPKRNLTEKQAQAQAVLPLHLVPIRIDLSIAPYVPEPALPKPHNARDMGLDEFAPAYRQPEITPEYRIKDYFLWNLHETLTTPDQFAKVFVDDLDLPNERKQALIVSMSQQIRSQLEEHAAVELHPFFVRDRAQTAQQLLPRPRPPLSRDQSSTPLPGTPLPAAARTGAVGTLSPADPAADAEAISAIAERVDPLLNPDDALRCVVTLSLNLQNRLLTDKFEWSLLHPPGVAEAFAKQTCADLGLSGEWVPALSHSIYEAVLKLKKDVVENNGSLLGVVGSGVNAWGEIENEVAEVHGDASLMVGEGAGWRFDNDALGIEWEPKIEVLSKDEIEKREGDRERQLRRMRRDMAARAAPLQRESFYGGLGEAGGDEERMGRGERAKKKRRFRSLSPAGRDSPDNNGAFGGEAGKLNEGERQTWRCSHCQIWGSAIWSVRDGPSGTRTLCNNCGLLYEQNKALPPWSRDLYAGERDCGTVSSVVSTSRPPLQSSHSYGQQQSSTSSSQPLHHQPLAPAPLRALSTSTSYNDRHSPSRMSPIPREGSQPQGDRLAGSSSSTYGAFVPNPARALSQTFYRHSSSYVGQAPASSQLGEQYAATLRGGGPQMFDDYSVEGEDLDWTKVTDPRERKRLQNIINGRKYRERRLAMDGEPGFDGGQSVGSPGGGSQLDYDGEGGGYGAGGTGYL